MEDIYKEKGYKDRSDYLEQLAIEFGVDLVAVLELATIFGQSEDFDGLVAALQDIAILDDLGFEDLPDFSDNEESDDE